MNDVTRKLEQEKSRAYALADRAKRKDFWTGDADEPPRFVSRNFGLLDRGAAVERSIDHRPSVWEAMRAYGGSPVSRPFREGYDSPSMVLEKEAVRLPAQLKQGLGVAMDGASSTAPMPWEADTTGFVMANLQKRSPNLDYAALQEIANLAREQNPIALRGRELMKAAAADLAENELNIEPYSLLAAGVNGVEWAASALPTIVATLATRKPGILFGVNAAQRGADLMGSYADGRLAGHDPARAAVDAAVLTLIDSIPGEKKFKAMFKPSRAFLPRMFKEAGAQSFGTVVNSILQDAYQKGVVEGGQDWQTWDDFNTWLFDDYAPRLLPTAVEGAFDGATGFATEAAAERRFNRSK